MALLVKNPPADAGDLKDAASGEGETCGKSNMETYTAAAAAKSRQPCPTLCDPIDGSPPGSCPWDSPGKNTGVGWKLTLPYVKSIANGNLLSGLGNSYWGSVSA